MLCNALEHKYIGSEMQTQCEHKVQREAMQKRLISVRTDRAGFIARQESPYTHFSSASTQIQIQIQIQIYGYR